MMRGLHIKSLSVPAGCFKACVPSFPPVFVSTLFLPGFSELDHYVVAKLPKDWFFEKVINPYLPGVMMHPKTLEYRDGVLHIKDLEGPKKEGEEKARLRDVEQ